MLKVSGFLLPLVFLICLKEGYSFNKGKIRVKRDSVKIVDGDKTCITNCSRMSSENDVFMQCSINECGVLETSTSTSQPSEILKPHEDIYLEKYHDGNEDRLALYVKWSPVDNVSLKETKGYQINITDGHSHYSTCYYFSTLMVFLNNAHDTYYNDCFGKVKGTWILPNSEIKITITNLPLWVANRNDGTKTATIEVPGGRPTTQGCVSKSGRCDTSSVVNGKKNDVACSVSKFNFGLAGPVNRTVTGSVSRAIHVDQPQEWYKYIDPSDDKKEVKLALNFSWMPSRDSSLESLKHYYLELLSNLHSSVATFDTCFSIHTPLTQQKHENVTFYYDCYGRSEHSRYHPVEPGDSYRIHIESRPAAQESSMAFNIVIPGCESPAMKDVAKCAGKGQIHLKILEKFCHNLSIKVNYSLPLGSESDVRLYICKTGMGLEVCGTHIQDYRTDGPSGIVYLPVPSSTKLHQNLSIFIHAADLPHKRVVDFFNFSKCAPTAPNRLYLYIMIVISCLLCLVALFSVVCYFRQGQCALKRFITSVCRHHPDPTHQHYPNIADETAPIPVPCDDEHKEGSAMPENVRVYVVFMDDHHLHKEVVHWFCSFLKQDLGLDVRLNIWEEGHVATNQNKYMMDQVTLAHKVIIICSAGTEGCLNRPYCGDMITPVIRQACNQTFIGKDPGKFLIGYFPYSKPEHIPEMLHDQCKMYFSAFKLMKQFEQFYFRIVGVEQFQEGGIQRIEKIAFDRYYDPMLTSCGLKLKTSIEAMAGFNRENRTWYTDQYGVDMPVANIPLAPSELREESQPLYGDGNASIVRLESNPPPGFQTNFPQKPRNAEPMTATVYMPIQPANHEVKGKLGEYQKLSSVTSTDDSSFILTDPDQMSPTTPDTPRSQPYPKRSRQPPLQRNSSGDNSQSFHAASFNDDDFAAIDSIDSSMDSHLLSSNVTQITRLGLTKSQEELTGANLLGERSVLDDAVFDNHVPGPLTLANLDDHVDNIEDTIRTINFDSEDYQTGMV